MIVATAMSTGVATVAARPEEGRQVGSTKVSDEMLQLVLANVAPCTLPSDAYGPVPMEWVSPRVPVWAWVSWPHRAAERVAGWATGWNDRVVAVAWETDRGERSTIVWRSAVSRRSAHPREIPGR
ncbi:hypothetical protein GCM10009816_12510 [Microbacterium aquimaris]